MLRSILRLVSAKYRKQIFLIFVCSILLALIEMIGVASIGPFMALVSSPEIIYENKYLFKAFTFLNYTNSQDFLITIGYTVITLILIVNLFTAFMGWFLNQFSTKLAHYISTQLLSVYLNQPYGFFLNRNSADLGKNVLSESHRSVSGVIAPAIEIISKLIVSLFIIALLIIIDPYIALFSILGVGITYILIFFFFRVSLQDIGEKSTKSVLKRYKVSNEAFSSIKELKLYGKERVFIDRFRKASFLEAGYTIRSNLVAFLPRHFLESLIFSGIIFAIIRMIDSGKSGVDIIPIFSVYAFAGYRLMPMFQHIYRSTTVIKYNFPALKILIKDFETMSLSREKQKSSVEDFSLSSYVELKSVFFNYENDSKSSLKDINIIIKHPSKVGIVGKTGSGKTTLVDLILGLFDSKSGEFIVDGHKINTSNKNTWQKNLGYVPQDIYLLDDTIIRNIAFAVKNIDIDFSMVERAAKLAGIHDFINTLPDKYETSVGEKGVRLSGGQLQRIGIARALYFDPKLIVFDESTSALDRETEQAIMEAINALKSKKTIIMIAHRVSTLQDCDVIYKMSEGKIIAKGSYKELLSNNNES